MDKTNMLTVIQQPFVTWIQPTVSSTFNMPSIFLPCQLFYQSTLSCDFLVKSNIVRSCFNWESFCIANTLYLLGQWIHVLTTWQVRDCDHVSSYALHCVFKLFVMSLFLCSYILWYSDILSLSCMVWCMWMQSMYSYATWHGIRTRSKIGAHKPYPYVRRYKKFYMSHICTYEV